MTKPIFEIELVVSSLELSTKKLLQSEKSIFFSNGQRMGERAIVIDEVGEEEVNAEDDSSFATSEDEDDWCDDYFSNNSVRSQSEAGSWLDGDPQIDVEKKHQQSGNDGLGGANTKGNQEPDAEKDNDCGTEAEEEESRYLENIELGGRLVDEAVKAQDLDDQLSSQVAKHIGPQRGEAHGVKKGEVQDVNIWGANSELKYNGINSMDGSTQINRGAEKEISRSNKLSNPKIGGQEKDTNRNSKKWDGGMSMRLFNKVVRNRNRRRGIFSDRSRRSEKAASCPKSMLSSQTSRLRESADLSEVKLGEEDGSRH
ncbi:hypothetical protein L1887_01212 [Cichorium endivia]|nr:hypothetical protein L1887_01212 [Cichorium endivia]